MVSRSVCETLCGAVNRSGLAGRKLRALAMRLLSELPHYEWAGVYRLEGDTLILDEYVGAPTEHKAIPVGRGVCGSAVARNRNQVVQDVGELDNYLSCSLETKAEIVVLIRDMDGRILGQIDVDGHEVACFDETDEEMLEALARVLSERWEEGK